MRKFTSKPGLNRNCLFFILLLFCLLISPNVFSRHERWNGDFVKVNYNSIDNTITFKFIVYDYYFGDAGESGFLRWCDFAYTTESGDEPCYYELMRAETEHQGVQDWTWLTMRYKRPKAQLQFIGCYEPATGAMWPEGGDDETINVKNGKKKDVYLFMTGKFYNAASPVCMFTVKWYLGKTYKNVKRIKLNGFWKVWFPYVGDDITNVYYDIPSASNLKSTELKGYIDPEVKSDGNTMLSRNSEVNISKEADAVVIKGAESGANICIYTTSGKQIKSIVTNNDVVKIKLPENQIYIVQIGQARYKVAL